MSTLAQFRTAVGRKLGLAYDSSGDERDAIDAWINEGIVDVLLETHCHVSSQTVTPGTSSDYTLTSAVLAVISMYFSSGGSDYELEQVSVEELLEMRRNGAAPTSTGTSHFALAGGDLILFWPSPGSSDTVTMYYVAAPTALSASSDDPATVANGGIRSEFQKAIEFYALAEGADYDDDSTAAQGQRYRDRYREELARIKRILNRRAAQQRPRAKPGRRRTVPRYNDTDGYWR